MRHLNLLYHRVNELEPDPWDLCVSPRNFEEQLEVIKRMSPRPTITFDDGYFDNLGNALPLLEKHEVGAHFFITSGAIGRESEMWWDALDLLYPEPKAYEREFTRLRGLRFDEQEQELARAYDERQQSRQPRAGRRMLTHDELCALASSPLVTIGAHTVTHPVLSRLSPDDQRAEIEGSKKQLEDWLGRRIAVFSYPNGMDADYTRDTLRIACDAGFASAYSAFEHTRTDPFEQPRRMIRNWNGQQFQEEIARPAQL